MFTNIPSLLDLPSNTTLQSSYIPIKKMKKYWALPINALEIVKNIASNRRHKDRKG